MSGDSFTGLTNAKIIKFGGNDCIDDEFLNSHEVSSMVSVITKKCGHKPSDSEKTTAEKVHDIEVMLKEVTKKVHEIAGV